MPEKQLGPELGSQVTPFIGNVIVGVVGTHNCRVLHAVLAVNYHHLKFEVQYLIQSIYRCGSPLHRNKYRVTDLCLPYILTISKWFSDFIKSRESLYIYTDCHVVICIFLPVAFIYAWDITFGFSADENQFVILGTIQRFKSYTYTKIAGHKFYIICYFCNIASIPQSTRLLTMISFNAWLLIKEATTVRISHKRNTSLFSRNRCITLKNVPL